MAGALPHQPKPGHYFNSDIDVSLLTPSSVAAAYAGKAAILAASGDRQSKSNAPASRRLPDQASAEASSGVITPPCTERTDHKSSAGQSAVEDGSGSPGLYYEHY
jgi:hypothetical protein